MLAQGVAGREKREVKKREVRRRDGREDERVQVDPVLLLGADPAVRDGADAQRLGRLGDGDGEGEVERRRVRPDEHARELQDRQVLVVLDPDPEGLERAVLLLGPLERLAQLDAHAQEVVRERLQRRRDGE